MNIVYWVLGAAWLLGMTGFGVISYREGERRAMRVAFGLALGGGALFGLFGYAPVWVQAAGLMFLGLGFLAGVIGFFWPVARVEMGVDTPKKRVDERDIMFARARLQPGTPEYESYYAMRPENKAVDDRTRAKPGLLSPDAKLANPYQFASPEGSFFMTDALREAADGPVAEKRSGLPPEEMTAYLKELALFYGAREVGVCTVQPYHVYSHIGRGVGEYGAPLEVEGRYAIAFTVEMAHEMVTTSPTPPTSMETAKQYVEAARVAVQLAATIRALGYPARAHIDGNYRVIAPLVARDAGLGEIGRMGLLMTPNYGPRHRLGVVTTDVELIPDVREADPSVIDFCNICKKCAENCPSKSISFDERQEFEGALRWKIDSETCFHYWNVVGTDCGRCMAVCPYSHPDTFSHNLIRWGIRNSGGFRRGALWLDDLFYGANPKTHPAPGWVDAPSKANAARSPDSG